MEEITKIPYDYIKDPIYGYIVLYEHEAAIINTPPFQRLRRIRQLPSASLVYPGATHDRFSHSLGVMHLSGLFANQILKPFIGEGIEKDEAQRYFFLLRLWGLTHDIGHGPFSHTFDSAILSGKGLNHEYMGARVVLEHPDILDIFERELNKFNITSKKLAEYLGKTREEWAATEKIGSTGYTDEAFYHILKGFYSMDIIDYILRDNLYTGAGYGNFDWQRLIVCSHLYKNEICLEKKARDSLDALLLSRLFSFNTIYYHRWSRAIDYVIRKLLERTDEIIQFERYVHNVKEYCELDEQSLLFDERLKAIPERNMLLNREIPYRAIDERRLDIPAALRFITTMDLSSRMRDELKESVPAEVYFVDTPYLPLNPMIGDEWVCLVDTTEEPPTMEWEPVRKTSWGQVPYPMWTIRLYLDKRNKEYERSLKDAFTSIFGEPSSTERTHF